MTAKSGIALGTFDGIHKGHKAVLDAVLDDTSLTPVCLAFGTPTAYYKHHSGLLMQPEVKREKLYEMGFKKVDFLEFRQCRDMSAVEFLDMLREKYSAASLSCGFNYRFGKNASGDVNFLREYCDSHGISLNVAEPVTDGEEVVSSTLIRDLVAKGELSRANGLLGKALEFSSKVIDGAHRGRLMGFPTINQPLPDGFVVPKFGVYATSLTVEGKKYLGITNIGVHPTFPLPHPISETHILNYKGNLYGKEITLHLLSFVREERRFKDINELRSAIEQDRKTITKGEYKWF